MADHLDPPRQTAELFFRSDMRLGEGPVWDERAEQLYVVDILDGRLYVLSPDGQQITYYDFDRMVGAVVPMRSEGLLVAQSDRIIQFLPEEGDIHELVALEPEITENRANDGKCDARGRFYIGTMNMEETDPQGALYQLAPDLSLNKVTDKRTISNGLAWTKDERTLYYIDSPTRQVVQFSVDPETGLLSDETVCFPIPEGRGFPDGMTIDQEGMLWVAHYDGACVARYDPATGKTLHMVDVPAPHVTSCAFGGPHNEVLYITTARKDLTRAQAIKFPLAGSVFSIKTGYRGGTTVSFNR